MQIESTDRKQQNVWIFVALTFSTHKKSRIRHLTDINNFIHWKTVDVPLDVFNKCVCQFLPSNVL